MAQGCGCSRAAPGAILRGGVPAFGFGDAKVSAPAPPPEHHEPSAWTLTIASTVLGAATGWLLDEVTRGIRGQR